jgi:putative transposase
VNVNRRLLDNYRRYAATPEAFAVLFVKKNIKQAEGHWVDITGCEQYEMSSDHMHFRMVTGGKGDCWDNAVAESFFASLKKERVQWRSYQTRAEAQQDILDYIVMFYNNRRLHSTLDYRSPNDYESATDKLREAA